MKSFLPIFQILIALFLGAAILLQQRSGGLSSIFGQESASYHSRRGMEKIVFRSTIALSILFLALAFANILIR